MDNVPQIFANDSSHQSEIVRPFQLFLEIGFLGFVNALLASAYRNHKSIRHPVFLETYVKRLLEVSEKERSCDSSISLRFRTSVDLERIICLGTFRRRQVGKEVVTVGMCIENRR